jgi:hypothetical protein
VILCICSLFNFIEGLLNEAAGAADAAACCHPQLVVFPCLVGIRAAMPSSLLSCR